MRNFGFVYFGIFDAKDASRSRRPIVENNDKIIKIGLDDRHVTTISIDAKLWVSSYKT